jgi:L-rhamnose 1-dehydrogenase
MSTLLAGKVVCITGSSRGIGRATALAVVKHGATGLILHYFGDEATTSEIGTLRTEVASINPNTKVVDVSGDISNPNTSTQVET